MEVGDASSLPAFDLPTLDEDRVSDLLASLGFPYYEAQIKEHGITGEILIHLDHEALKDVGIHSVGQRLSILKEVYRLKVQQNVPIEEGHYIPPSEEMEQLLEEGSLNFGSIPSQQMMEMLMERDDRISNLELEVQKLHDSLISLREDQLPPRPNSKQSTVRPIARSPTTQMFPHPLSNSSTLLQSRSTNNESSSMGSGIPDTFRSPLDSPRIQDEISGRMGGDYNTFASGALTPTSPTPFASGRDRDEGSLSTANSGFLNAGVTISQGVGANVSSITLPPMPSSGSRPTTGEKERLDRSATSSNADNPYRSFRVTLEDPCYKVLPAALKKYKIIDDWRQYALFICYGNTERCLSYDEKPLLLFQKLKEGNANPVFMLRHIKDIKSPIAVATAKHALRRDKRPANAGVGLDKPPAMARDGTTLSTTRGTRLHHPPVLLPVGGGKDKEGEEERPLASPREAPGYCISIYPYLAEREDEFDVTVGDTFLIISKTKGWWVVYRDLGSRPLSPGTLANRKSAWVPAGCLLETSVPPLSLADTNSLSSSSPHNAANLNIMPIYVVSVSTPGIALMDYVKNGSDQLDVKKGTSLRILKRYNHWSYAIKEDGQRGWIPSWFCGRASRAGDGPTTPTTASRLRPSDDDPSNAIPRSLSPADGRVAPAPHYELP